MVIKSKVKPKAKIHFKKLNVKSVKTKVKSSKKPEKESSCKKYIFLDLK